MTARVFPYGRGKKQRRGTLSVSAKLYERLVTYSRSSGEPISALVERLLRPVLSADEDKTP